MMTKITYNTQNKETSIELSEDNQQNSEEHTQFPTIEERITAVEDVLMELLI
jgi:hypothetical protein